MWLPLINFTSIEALSIRITTLLWIHSKIAVIYETRYPVIIIVMSFFSEKIIENWDQLNVAHDIISTLTTLD